MLDLMLSAAASVQLGRTPQLQKGVELEQKRYSVATRRISKRVSVVSQTVGAIGSDWR